jgi:hypothetical protein
LDERTDLPIHSPYRFRRAQPKARSSYHTVSCHCSHLGSDPGLGRLAPVNLHSPTPRRHLAVQTISGGSGISTGCPSPTTFVLGLGPTNPEWTSLPQETLGLRRVGFSPTSRYSCRHSHFRPLQPSSRSTFTADGTLPYHPAPANRHQVRSFGTRLEPR